MRTHCVLGALLVFLGLCSAGCGGKGDGVGKDAKAEAETESEEKGKKTEELVPVEVVAIARGEIEAVIQASTNLDAEARVQVFARTTNLATELLVEEGDQVDRGRVLLRLEDDTQKIQVAKARARFEKATKEFNREKDLVEKELITVQEYNEAAYELQQAQLLMDEAQQELSYTRITAPIAGTITHRMVKQGDQVNLNQHLFDIVDFDSLVARVYLPEKNLSRLAIGQRARLTSQALGNRTFAGTVDRIAPVVDAKTGTVKVTVKVDEIGLLRPGMFVEVALVLETHHDALLIPKRAIVYDSDQVFVFRLLAGNEVERLLLVPVLTDKDFVEPEPGFQEGDRIVIAGQTGLKNGAKVRVLGENAEPVTPGDGATDAEESENSPDQGNVQATAAEVSSQ